MLKNVFFSFFLQHRIKHRINSCKLKHWLKGFFLFHTIFWISSKGMLRKYVQNVEPLEPSFKCSSSLFLTCKMGSWRILDFTFKWNLRKLLVYCVVQFFAFLCSCILEYWPFSWWLNDWMRKWVGFLLGIEGCWLRFYLHLLIIRWMFKNRTF